MKDLTRVCAYCGKPFLCERTSVYKVKVRRHIKRMCSYTCWMKYKEELLVSKTVIKNRLREYRDRSRLTLQEVSILTGYDVTTISRHESGQRSLSDEAMKKYAALYKVETHELLDLRGVNDDGEQRTGAGE